MERRAGGELGAASAACGGGCGAVQVGSAVRHTGGWVGWLLGGAIRL
jgi:hypothetical protein